MAGVMTRKCAKMAAVIPGATKEDMRGGLMGGNFYLEKLKTKKKTLQII